MGRIHAFFTADGWGRLSKHDCPKDHCNKGQGDDSSFRHDSPSVKNPKIILAFQFKLIITFGAGGFHVNCVVGNCHSNPSYHFNFHITTFGDYCKAFRRVLTMLSELLSLTIEVGEEVRGLKLWSAQLWHSCDVYKVTHSVWKSQKKSHSTLQAKRATFTFWVDKS